MWLSNNHAVITVTQNQEVLELAFQLIDHWLEREAEQKGSERAALPRSDAILYRRSLAAITRHVYVSLGLIHKSDERFELRKVLLDGGPQYVATTIQLDLRKVLLGG